MLLEMLRVVRPEIAKIGHTAHTPHGVKNTGDVVAIQLFGGKTILTGNSTTIALMFLPKNASTLVNEKAAGLEAIVRLNPTKSKKNGSSRGPANTVMSPTVVVIGVLCLAP